MNSNLISARMRHSSLANGKIFSSLVPRSMIDLFGLNPQKSFLENFLFTFGGYDANTNELAIEVGVLAEDYFYETDDLLKNWYFYPYAYFLL